MTDQLSEACGTAAGYYRHKRRADEPCDPCRLAINAYVATRQRDRRGAARSAVSAPAAQCGTRGGYRRHQRNGEDPCDPCREANNEYVRVGYQRKAQAASDPGRCPDCRYLLTAPGHKATCETGAMP